MAWFKMEYENGYCGNDHEEYIEADDLKEAEMYAEEGLHDWAESNCLGVQGYSWGEGWESQEAEEEYYEGCSFTVTEVETGCGDEPCGNDCETCSDERDCE